VYSSSWKYISQLQGVTCLMESRSVTFHRTQVNTSSAKQDWGEILAVVFFKLIRTDWQSRIFDLTSDLQDGGHDVISRRKVLPPGEWSMKRLLGACAAAYASSWSIVHSYTCYVNRVK